MDSWRPGTRKQYDVYIRKWETFSSQEKSDPLLPNVNEVLKFLHNLHIKQLSYSTINSTSSALSNYSMGFHFSKSHFTVSNHPFIVCYLKGVFNRCKPSPRYQEIWDVQPVLDYIELLSLNGLTLKLTILLALTSGQRCQKLALLKTNAMKGNSSYYLFSIQDHVKQDRPSKLLSSFVVRQYLKELLYTYITLQR